MKKNSALEALSE